MSVLLYQGHGSCRFTTNAGTVVYVDPYAGEGYDLPADLILVTHDHHDHNQVTLMPHQPDCTIITSREALVDGVYRRFSVQGVEVEAVPAYNRNHARASCVGYVLRFDSVSVYCAGDTSETDAMSRLLPGYRLDYALLPIDGVYNMGPEAASRCAEIIGAKRSIPIHMAPGKLFDRACAESFHVAGRLILEPGEEWPL